MSLHLVGNKAAEEGISLSKSNVSLDSDIKNILTKFFLNAFTPGETFHFYHDSGLEYNVVYGAVSKIFEEPTELYEQSVNLAKYLYENSSHPKI